MPSLVISTDVSTSVSLWPASFISWAIPGVQESPGIFTHAALLGNCEHLFQSESSCQIFLSLQCMVDLPQSKIFLICLQWPKHGDFPAISPAKSVPQTSRACVYHYFPTMWAVCFHSYFQSAAAVPIAVAKGIQFPAWPLGNPYLTLFSRVSRATASLTRQELMEPDV